MSESSDEAVTFHAEWNPDLELVVKREGEQSQSLFWLHNEASTWSAFRNDVIQIPTIVLASVTGFLSATTVLVPPIGIGAMALFTGILGTVNSYYKYSQKSEAHKVTAQLYLKTYKNIETELALPVYQRENANMLLKELRHTMARISEIAPPIPSNIIDKYNRVFKGYNVSSPIITNGLAEINICKAVVDPKADEMPKMTVSLDNIISTAKQGPLITHRSTSPIANNSTQTIPWPSAISRSTR